MKTLETTGSSIIKRIRERLMKHRTATEINCEGLLEYGIVLPGGFPGRYLRTQVPMILEDAEQPLTIVARGFVHRLYRELVGHDRQISELEAELFCNCLSTMRITSVYRRYLESGL